MIKEIFSADVLINGIVGRNVSKQIRLPSYSPD